MFALGTPLLPRAVCASNSAIPAHREAADPDELEGCLSPRTFWLLVGKCRQTAKEHFACRRDVARVRAIRASVCSQPPRLYLSRYAIETNAARTCQQDENRRADVPNVRHVARRYVGKLVPLFRGLEKSESPRARIAHSAYLFPCVRVSSIT